MSSEQSNGLGSPEGRGCRWMCALLCLLSLHWKVFVGQCLPSLSGGSLPGRFSGSHPLPVQSSGRGRDPWTVSRLGQWLEQRSPVFSLPSVLKEASVHCPEDDCLAQKG